MNSKADIRTTPFQGRIHSKQGAPQEKILSPSSRLGLILFLYLGPFITLKKYLFCSDKVRNSAQYNVSFFFPRYSTIFSGNCPYCVNDPKMASCMFIFVLKFCGQNLSQVSIGHFKTCSIAFRGKKVLI